MRSVQERLAAVLALVGPVEPLDVVLHDAAGCVLACDVVAPADVPATAVAGCDGYAVLASDTRSGREKNELARSSEAIEGVDKCSADHTRSGREENERARPVEPVGGAGDLGVLGAPRLPVAHDARPGADSPRLVPGQAVRVASGAPLPPGADAVTPLEATDRDAVTVTLQPGVVPGAHVLAAGHDVRGGTVVLVAGTRLGARQIGLAAAVGRSRLRVHPSPRVVVVAVGDELVEPGTDLQPGQVYESNRFALEAAVREAGCTPVRVPVVGDDRAGLRETLEDQLVRADVVVLTGGLSEAAHDTVKDVLPLLGDVRLDQVAMTPGGRLGAGLLNGMGRDVPVLALPGRPVAALVAFEMFVRPALGTMAGLSAIYRPSVPAVVSQGWRSPPGLRQLVPVAVVGDPSGYAATVLGDPAQPGLADVARADALAVVSEAQQEVRAGQTLPCLVLRG